MTKARESLFDALRQEAEFAGYGGCDVAPHDFKPLKRWRNRGRCSVCLVHEEHHPTRGWLPARPYRVSREALRGH